MADKKKEIDAHSQVETTGHEWDGLKELNYPAPRWWLIVFFACFVWAVGYWIVYPAWPTLSGNTKGTAHWSEYKKLKNEQAEIVARRSKYLEEFRKASFDEIKNNAELTKYAQVAGASAFKENCAACHGTGAQGGHGYPNLNDDDWIWGGKIEDIYHTIKVGIRSAHPDTRTNTMPSFKDVLTAEQQKQVASYVASFDSANAEGAKIFSENCAACHGAKGEGSHEMGAPRLNDAIWLYGKDNIPNQIKNPRHGVMPTWESRLDDDTIKALAVYIHSLGGGE